MTTAHVAPEQRDGAKLKRELSFDDQETVLPKKQLIIIFLSLGFALVLAFIDTTSVSTAQSSIADDLQAGASITWVGTSYYVSTTSFQLIYGRLSDIFGRRVLLASALAFLAVGDLLCGFAQTPIQLYAFRAISGIGGGGITNMSMIVSDVTTLRERGKWQGYIVGAVALGSAIGPFVGAALAQHATWRAIFWLMPPCAVICGVVCWLFIPLRPVTGNTRDKLLKVDWLGNFLSLAGNLLILVPISGGGSLFAWDSGVFIGCIVAGVLAWALFIVTEWKWSVLPVLPLRLFTYWTTSLSMPVNFLYGMVFYANIYVLPVYWQKVGGTSELTSACLLLPLMLLGTLAGAVIGQCVMRTGRLKPFIISGFVIWTMAQGLQIMFTRRQSVANMVGILVVQGWGTGQIFQSTLVAAQAGAPPKDRAVVTGARNFFRSMGGAFGLAISNAVYQNVAAKAMPAEVTSQIRDEVFADGTISAASLGVSAETLDGILDALQKGFTTVFILYVPLVGACLLISLLFKEVGLPGAAPASGTSAPTEKDVEAGSTASASTVAVADTAAVTKKDDMTMMTRVESSEARIAPSTS